MNNFMAPEISVASINCNSLNMSNSGKYMQKNKIYGIAKLKTDIIFLSDVRISNRNRISGLNEISKIFQMNSYCQYNFLVNSTMNKRGTGILIKHDIPYSEHGRAADPEENFLLILAEIKGKKIILGSIYGPNDHNKDFFTRLSRAAFSLGQYPIILGGDWNCTVSQDPVNTNVDCLNMVALPNARHSLYLDELCQNLDLLDPYRGLFPNRKDYTYIPRSVLGENRSRIDFFLTSREIFHNVTDCEILPAMQSKLFDHRAIVLNFYKKKKTKSNRSSISGKILNYPDLDFIVKTATAECYIHNIDADMVEGFNRDRLLEIIGLTWLQIKSLGPPFKASAPFEFTDEEVNVRNLTRVRITNLLNSLHIHDLQNLPLTVDCSIFLETLLNSIKNEVCSYQHFISVQKNKLCHKTVDEIRIEKSGPAPDFSKIKNLEKILLDFNENELRLEVEKSPLYEFINSEKITPTFLKLIKGSKNDARLSDIKRLDGSDFATDTERDEYIVSYFENIYKVPPDTIPLLPNAIAEFLGPDVMNNPIVTNSKLSRVESEGLEADISLLELDNCVAECKARSAAGPDGIGNAFIKKFWYLLRIPTQLYANFCFNSGTLTQTFSTGAIRLIPKKGDTHQIKNWRPISLLNNIYKIISRAINNRLKKVADRILSRAQKGFNPSRYIQEVLINVIETISRCNNSNSAGFIVAIDEAKAFDSLRHDFMEQTWEFFGFGRKFSKMLKTITRGRSSCIILGDNSYSRPFNIETGSMQGDSPSPLIFDFNQQIAIFKIELDPEITKIFFNFMVPRPVFAAAPPFELESNRESCKVDAFADDTTAMVEATLNNLVKLKNLLTDFGSVSGLKCNFDKTSVMPVGNRVLITEEMRAVGFAFTEKICLLGLEISNDLATLSDLHDTTLKKIRKICGYWARFNLSLPGRINVAKCLLLSQINYLGCILNPSPQQLKDIISTVEKFIAGKLNIARDRFYTSTSEGGLGMINIPDFLTAQQAIWVKHTHISTRDCWRYDLMAVGGGNCLTISAAEINQYTNPILKNIATSFDLFRKSFYSLNDNYKDMYLLNNPLIHRGQRDRGLLTVNFFTQVPPIPRSSLAKLKFSDVYREGGMRMLAEINQNLDFNLNLVTYLRLGESCTNFITRLHAGRASDGTNLNIERFLLRFKSGSKQVRNVLALAKKHKTLPELTHMKSFLRLTGLGNPDTKHLSNAQGFWSFGFIPNTIRDFIFKFNNNILGLNTRVSHFVAAHARSCCFCVLRKVHNPPDETFSHLFFDCETTNRYLRFFENLIFREKVNVTVNERKLLWFLGVVDATNTSLNTFLGICIWLVRYLVWDAKLKKKLPNNVALKQEFFYHINNIFEASPIIRHDRTKYDSYFCRNWDQIRRG
jgi:exonuclease III